jgi:hypothetical protein
MFEDFNYKDVLMCIDTLISDKHYGSFEELTNLTLRELREIINIVISKQQEEELTRALSSKG